jgi:hypothetical protein
LGPPCLPRPLGQHATTGRRLLRCAEEGLRCCCCCCCCCAAPLQLQTATATATCCCCCCSLHPPVVVSLSGRTRLSLLFPAKPRTRFVHPFDHTLNHHHHHHLSLFNLNTLTSKADYPSLVSHSSFVVVEEVVVVVVVASPLSWSFRRPRQQPRSSSSPYPEPSPRPPFSGRSADFSLLHGCTIRFSCTSALSLLRTHPSVVLVVVVIL